MKIAILDLGRFKYGGIPTYSYHLRQALESQNIEVDVISHRDKCYIDKRIRMGPLMINEINKHNILIVNGCFVDKNDMDRISGILNKCLDEDNRYVIVHDPAEKLTLLEKVKFKKLITISKRNSKTFSKISPIETDYTIHPYKRWSDYSRNEYAWRHGFKEEVISTSRVDFDKHYENILRAADRGLISNYKIYTGYVHRPYVYFKLDRQKITKVDWDTKYYLKYVVGGFEFTKYDYKRVYDKAAVLLDLSYIKGDGGRSQYTFLEAFDFGTPIVLSKLWDPKDKYWVDGKNCLKADPDNIHSIGQAVNELLNNKHCRERLINNGYEMLKKHNYKKIGRKFARILGV